MFWISAHCAWRSDSSKYTCDKEAESTLVAQDLLVLGVSGTYINSELDPICITAKSIVVGLAIFNSKLGPV